MHSQLLLWNYSDVHNQEAASSPLYAPCDCTSHGLPSLPAYLCMLFVWFPITQRVGGAGLALGLYVSSLSSLKTVWG